jgi:UDP-N-acetylmuramoyl-tripeptide--D-alanyl-D-alanine ligase
MPIELHLAGSHNVLNALCAAAAATAAGASLEDVRSGLATMRPVSGRLQFKTAPSGAWIVDDSYNANPSSMKAGIEVLASVDARRWLVMGDMGELGEAANDSHGEVGRFARDNHVDRLFATGKLSALAVEAFGPGAEWFADAESLARAVNAELTREVCVLVKGSRSARLERVVDALTGTSSDGAH